jgi:RNA polymerase sigma factor (sigma-70 family)
VRETENQKGDQVMRTNAVSGGRFGDKFTRSPDAPAEVTEDLLGEAYRVARGIFRRYGVVMPHEDPDELAHEGVLQALRSYELRKGADFGLHLRMCVRQTVLNALRRETRREGICRANPLAAAASVPGSLGPPEALDLPGFAEILELAPEADRTVLDLVYRGGLTQVQAAERLGTTKGVVGGVQARGLERLRSKAGARWPSLARGGAA